MHSQRETVSQVWDFYLSRRKIRAELGTEIMEELEMRGFHSSLSHSHKAMFNSVKPEKIKRNNP